MNIASMLEEAVATESGAPWDDVPLQEYFPGDRAFVPRFNRQPKYTGLIGPKFDAAVDKGYVDLGLVDPKIAKTIGDAKMANIIAGKVATMIQKKDIAFVRDPEDIIGTLSIDPKRIATVAKGEMESDFQEQYDLYSEAEDESSMALITKSIQGIRNAAVSAMAVSGKTSAGYKFTMRPTYSEIYDLGHPGRR